MRRSVIFAFGCGLLGTSPVSTAAEKVLPATGPLLGVPDDDRAWTRLIIEVGVLGQQGLYEAAYTLALKALREAERFGSEDFRVGVTLGEVGLRCHFLGRYSKAESAYLRAIAIIEHNVTQRLAFAQVLQNLGSLYLEYGFRYSRAESLIRHAVELGTPLLGPDHPDIAAMLASLASACMMQRHDAQAQELFNRALAILERNTATHQPNLAGVLGNLGYLALRHGDHASALAYTIRSIALHEQNLGPSHPELVSPLFNLGRLYLELDRKALAEDTLRRAAAIATSGLGVGHPVLGEVLWSYAVALRKNGKKKESRKMETRVNAIRAGDPNRTAATTVHIADLVSKSQRKSGK